jgi:hypothetical protein
MNDERYTLQKIARQIIRYAKPYAAETMLCMQAYKLHKTFRFFQIILKSQTPVTCITITQIGFRLYLVQLSVSGLVGYDLV